MHTRYRWFWIRLSIARLIARVAGLRVVSFPVWFIRRPSRYPRDTIDIDIVAREMKIPEKISNSTEPASLEFTPFRADRSFLLCMPLRKSRDYSVVIYIRVSEAFLNIRSNAREKFGSTTRDLKFNSRHFYSTGIQGRCNNRSKLGHITKRLRNST